MLMNILKIINKKIFDVFEFLILAVGENKGQ